MANVFFVLSGEEGGYDYDDNVKSSPPFSNLSVERHKDDDDEKSDLDDDNKNENDNQYVDEKWQW